MLSKLISSLAQNSLKSVLKVDDRVDKLLDKFSVEDVCPPKEELQRVIIQKNQTVTTLTTIQGVLNGLVTTGYARYTKIGNLVQADCEITLANQTSANQMAISGLPFYISEDAAGIIAYTTSSTVSNTILGQATSMFFYTSGSTISTLANYSGSFIRAQITYRTTS